MYLNLKRHYWLSNTSTTIDYYKWYWDTFSPQPPPLPRNLTPNLNNLIKNI